MLRSAIFPFKRFDGKCQNLQMSSTNFCANSHYFRYIKFFIFDLQKVGQDYGVKFLQFHRSMPNVKIYKCLSHIFALGLTVCEKLIFLPFDLENVDHGNG